MRMNVKLIAMMSVVHQHVIAKTFKGGVKMEKSSFKKAISKLKPKQQECCSVQIEENKQEPDSKNEQNNNNCC